MSSASFDRLLIAAVGGTDIRPRKPDPRGPDPDWWEAFKENVEDHQGRKRWLVDQPVAARALLNLDQEALEKRFRKTSSERLETPRLPTLIKQARGRCVRVVLLGSKQPRETDNRFRMTDTYGYACVLARVLPTLVGSANRLDVRTERLEGNPARFDEAYAASASVLAPHLREAREQDTKVTIGLGGGTPALGLAMQLATATMFDRRIDIAGVRERRNRPDEPPEIDAVEGSMSSLVGATINDAPLAGSVTRFVDERNAGALRGALEASPQASTTSCGLARALDAARAAELLQTAPQPVAADPLKTLAGHIGGDLGERLKQLSNRLDGGGADSWLARAELLGREAVELVRRKRWRPALVAMDIAAKCALLRFDCNVLPNGDGFESYAKCRAEDPTSPQPWRALRSEQLLYLRDTAVHIAQQPPAGAGDELARGCKAFIENLGSGPCHDPATALERALEAAEILASDDIVGELLKFARENSVATP